MTWRLLAGSHLREARLAVLGNGLPSSDRDERLKVYNELMALCQRHGLVAAEDDAPTPTLRRVA